MDVGLSDDLTFGIRRAAREGGGIARGIRGDGSVLESESSPGCG